METEESLVHRCIRGDPSAWETFVGRYAPLILFQVRDYIRRYGPAPAALSDEDLVSAVFLDLLRDDAHALRAYRSQGPMAAYLRLVVRTVCYREVVRRGRFAPSSSPPGLLVLLEGDVVDPPEAAATAEDLRLLRQEVDALPPHDRLPLLMVELDGVPRAEAARMLGLTPEALSQRIHRAKERIRAAFQRRAK